MAMLSIMVALPCMTYAKILAIWRKTCENFRYDQCTMGQSDTTMTSYCRVTSSVTCHVFQCLSSFI